MTKPGSLLRLSAQCIAIIEVTPFPPALVKPEQIEYQVEEKTRRASEREKVQRNANGLGILLVKCSRRNVELPCERRRWDDRKAINKTS
jgi:hypothetical protein